MCRRPCRGIPGRRFNRGGVPACRRHDMHHAAALGTGKNIADHALVVDDESSPACRAFDGEQFHG